jgi:hypothetical protein
MTVQELLSAAQELSFSEQVQLASQLMQTVIQNLQLSTDENPALTEVAEDPLIGLFAGSPDLSTCAKDILEKDVTSASGFTWKES